MQRPLSIGQVFVGAAILLWTLFPVYHILVMALTPDSEASAGQIWPAAPTLNNFVLIFSQGPFFLKFFWTQLLNSVVVAVSVTACTLVIATTASFAISRLRAAWGGMISGLALLTYLIPSAFLAIPMYVTMSRYGLLENRLSLILVLVTLASPYAIWVLKQYADQLPAEIDEAAKIDGASPMQIFRLVFIPLMAPALVAIGAYSFLLAWNEYLYAFLMLSQEQNVTLPIAMGHFLSSDDTPWNLLMATGIAYAMPPAIVYYMFRRFMVSGLTAGAVKG
jgi:multiple sugar transport system permease protein